MVETKTQETDLSLAQRIERDITNGLGYDSKSTYGLNPETDSRTIELVHDTPEGLQAHLALMESRTGWPSYGFFEKNSIYHIEDNFITKLPSKRVNSLPQYAEQKRATAVEGNFVALAELRARGNSVDVNYESLMKQIRFIERQEELNSTVSIYMALTYTSKLEDKNLMRKEIKNHKECFDKSLLRFRDSNIDLEKILDSKMNRHLLDFD